MSDHPSCSSIGSSILALGGNAVDASVAAALCLTAALPHSVGLGGGGIMLVICQLFSVQDVDVCTVQVHDLRRNRTRVIDFLEKSPASLDFRKYTEHLDIIKYCRALHLSYNDPKLIGGAPSLWQFLASWRA